MNGQRKCKFIINEYTKNDSGAFVSSQVIKFGLFHQFGTDIEEYENGGHEMTVGIIEDQDGKIYMPRAGNIQFLPNDYDMPGWTKWD